MLYCLERNHPNDVLKRLTGGGSIMFPRTPANAALYGARAMVYTDMRTACWEVSVPDDVAIVVFLRCDLNHRAVCMGTSPRAVWINDCVIGFAALDILKCPSLEVVMIMQNHYRIIHEYDLLRAIECASLKTVIVKYTGSDVTVQGVFDVLERFKRSLQHVVIKTSYCDNTNVDFPAFLRDADNLEEICISGGRCDKRTMLIDTLLDCPSLVKSDITLASGLVEQHNEQDEFIQLEQRIYLHPTVEMLRVSGVIPTYGAVWAHKCIERALRRKHDWFTKNLITYMRSRYFNPHIAQLIIPVYQFIFN